MLWVIKTESSGRGRSCRRERAILQVVILEPWELSPPGDAGKSRRRRSLPRLQKQNFGRARAPAPVESLVGGSFEMDWLLFAILIAAVGAHLIVAGFGR
jgi:hypothetical protein